ncbi:MAG: HEAT repeat domain-containing protein, partial [Spirochaetales bacterium]|nr:HEAT repeat domain-containing protein [Spirochaetales bacterium]
MTVKKMIFVILAAALVFPALSLSAQDRTQTIEERYLNQKIELQIIGRQANSNDWEIRSMALQNLRNMVDEGRITEDDAAAMTVLETLSKPQEQGGNLRNFNTIRREACELLGSVGGKKSQLLLLDVLALEKEPMVLAEAAYALGKIGKDENGAVMTRLSWLLHHENVKKAPDDNFANSTLIAMEKIAKGADGIKAPDILDVLIEALGSNYIPEVKSRARQV